MKAALSCLALLVCIGEAAAAEVDSGGSNFDLNRMAEASRAAYHGRYSDAIARAGAVIASSPDFAEAYLDRAAFYADAGRFDEAKADLARVEAFHPDAIQILLLRVQIALRQRDAVGALKELGRSASLPGTSYWKSPHEGSGNAPETGYLHLATRHTDALHYVYASIADEMLGQGTEALDALSLALKAESDKSYYALGAHCYYSAVVGLVEMAELTCGEAIAKQYRDIGDYDSLGLAHVKMKAWGKAIDDYNKALYTRPDLTVALYGRGVAKHALGDAAGGDADIAAAKRDEPDIVNIMARVGVSAG